MKLVFIVIFIFSVWGCSTANNKPPELPELSSEQIQLSFSKNSHLVYSVYNEALKQQPELSGKITLRVKAVYNQPNVCDVESVSKGLEAVALQICRNVEGLDFGRGKTKEFSYPIILSPN